jgi:hypothetical protein
MQLLGSQDKTIAQSSVHHYADDFQIRAAVARAASASKAMSAVHIGLDATAITNFDIRHSFADFQYFNAQFMTWNSGKVEKRKLAQVATYVGSTHAHSVCSHQSLAWSRASWFIDFDSSHPLWFSDLYGSHAVFPLKHGRHFYAPRYFDVIYFVNR